MRNVILVLAFICLPLIVGCETNYSGEVKVNTTAGEVKSVSVKLPGSGNTFTCRDRETVHKLILELEELTKQLKDAEERMPKKED